jgi:selenocysteine lyase/cysteine desulfurase
MQEVLAGWQEGSLQPAAFDEYVRRARTAWARLAGVDPTWVATGPSVSTFVGLVAASLPADAEVLVAEGDFTSVLFPFLVQERRGVSVRAVPLDELVGSVRGSTSLVAVSVVQSSDGRVLDVDALVAAAAEHGAQVLVDTTQSCGWLPTDCAQVDYAVCGAYKWLLAPRGTAFLSVRPDRVEALVPHAANWYAGGDVWGSIYGTPLRLATDARRFDISPAWLCWAGAAPSVELVAGLDATAVRAHDVGLADAFLDRMELPSQCSAIVTVDAPGAAEALAAAGVRAAVRAGRVRLSFHICNDDADVDLAVSALRGRR